MAIAKEIEIEGPSGEPLKLGLRRSTWFLSSEDRVRRFSRVIPTDEGSETRRYLHIEAVATSDIFATIRRGKVLRNRRADRITVHLTDDPADESHLGWLDAPFLVAGLGTGTFNWLWGELIERPDARLELIAEVESYGAVTFAGEGTNYIPEDSRGLQPPRDFNITVFDPPPADEDDEDAPKRLPVEAADQRLGTITNLLWAILGAVVVAILSRG